MIDLETGDQPMSCEDGTFTVVLNGEIYDFAARRARARGARPPLPVALGHRGRGPRLGRGGRRVDRAAERHVRDRALGRASRGALPGPRPDGGEAALLHDGAAARSSSPPSCARCWRTRRSSARLDEESLARYLAFDYVPDPHSILQGVHKLPPGHILRARDGGIELRRYWDIPYRPDARIDEPALHEEIALRFDRSVALRLVSDVPVGCFVSGGIDSTVVTGTAARQRSGIRTFSVGYDDSRHDERPWARIVARHFGTRHEELVVTADDAAGVLARLGGLLDEPLADMSFVPLHLLSCAARRTVTVALTGDGGDELFAGYPTMAADWWQRGARSLPASVLGPAASGRAAPAARRRTAERVHRGHGVPSRRLQPGAHRRHPAGPRRVAALARRARPARRSSTGTATSRPCWRRAPRDDATARLIYRYCKLYLAGQNLVNSDRASMATGLELRAPFLDHTFVEFMGRIPSALKLGGFGSLKRLLKRALADRLPPEILRRGKKGFGVPLGDWFRGPLSGFLRDVLAPDRLRRSGLFDVAAVGRLVDAHLRGERDHRKPLWSLLAFELWRLEYLGDGAA